MANIPDAVTVGGSSTVTQALKDVLANTVAGCGLTPDPAQMITVRIYGCNINLTHRHQLKAWQTGATI